MKKEFLPKEELIKMLSYYRDELILGVNEDNAAASMAKAEFAVFLKHKLQKMKGVELTNE